MKIQKLTKNQINKMPAKYTFVDGAMVLKQAAPATKTIDWEEMASDVELEPICEDEIFIKVR